MEDLETTIGIFSSTGYEARENKLFWKIMLYFLIDTKQ